MRSRILGAPIAKPSCACSCTRRRRACSQSAGKLMCPNCRVPKAAVDDLGELPPQFHCDTCGILYTVDVDSNVELRFSISPAVRTTHDEIYCIGGPLRMPHVVAQQ